MEGLLDSMRFARMCVSVLPVVFASWKDVYVDDMRRGEEGGLAVGAEGKRRRKVGERRSTFRRGRLVGALY